MRIVEGKAQKVENLQKELILHESHPEIYAKSSAKGDLMSAKSSAKGNLMSAIIVYQKTTVVISVVQCHFLTLQTVSNSSPSITNITANGAISMLSIVILLLKVQLNNLLYSCRD